MSNVTDFRSFIKATLGIDIKSYDQLPFNIYNKKVNVKGIFTDYGDHEDTIYFLTKGLVQVSVMSPKNEEKIVEFISPGNFFSAYASYANKVPSQIQLKAISPCEVEYTPQGPVQEALSSSLLINQLARSIMETLYLRRMNREIDFLTKTAEERYNELVEFRPDIIQMVSVKKIAQYLGVHPESVSRIRGALASGKKT